MKTLLVILLLALAVFSDQYVDYHPSNHMTNSLSFKDTGRSVTVNVINASSKSFTMAFWSLQPCRNPYTTKIQERDYTLTDYSYQYSKTIPANRPTVLFPVILVVTYTCRLPAIKMSFISGDGYIDIRYPQRTSTISSNETAKFFCQRETTTVTLSTKLLPNDTLFVRDTVYSAIETPVISPAAFNSTYKLFDVAGRLLASNLTERQANLAIKTRGIYILRSKASVKRICRL